MKTKRFLDILFVSSVLLNLAFVMHLYSVGWNGLYFFPLWIAGYLCIRKALARFVSNHIETECLRKLEAGRKNRVYRSSMKIIGKIESPQDTTRCIKCGSVDGIMYWNTDHEWVHLDCHDPDNIARKDEQFGTLY